MNRRASSDGAVEAGTRPAANGALPPAVGDSRLTDLLHDRLRFESLLARLSATFIHLPAEEVDGRIEQGLREIVEFLRLDRSTLCQFSEDGSELVATHSHSVAGIAPFPPVDLAATFPWYTSMIRRGEVMRFARLPDELPPEAVRERAYCADTGFRSHLIVPFTVGDKVLGGIGFGSFRDYHGWPDDLVQGLQLMGEIFANALARKRADLALRESEGRFRAMADTAPVMVWMSGPDKLRTYFNRTWLDFTGRPLSREVGGGWTEGVHPDDLPGCLRTYTIAFDGRQDFRMEYRLRRFDGAYHWILDTGVPRSDADGTFKGYIGSCIDISDQKRVEADLRESEERLRHLLESTHAIPWVASATTWRITYVGPQAARLLGYPPADWYADRFWVDHIHPDDRDWAVAFCLDRSQHTTDYEFEYRMVAADGRAVWLQDIVNVVVEDGKPRELRGFMIDVTARRRAEEDSRRSREQLARVGRASLLGELAATIAHEVNQPLCAIVANAQAATRLLANGNPDVGEVREALQDISRDGQRASGVIARVRGTLQQAPAPRSPVQVNDIIREVFALLQDDLARRGVWVRLDLDEGLPQVPADRGQVQQVILNLLSNGADAMAGMPPGAHELAIRSAGAAGGVTVAVTDSGVGIDAPDRERIFDAFFTTKPGSMGMGLAICRSIVEAHGGRIGVPVTVGSGTTIQFSLPGTPGDHS
jgi:PAS domain S-box-containing protein